MAVRLCCRFLFEQGWLRRRVIAWVRIQKRKSQGSSFPELLTRLELVTSSLPRKCSTTELQQQRCIICANLPRGWSGRRDSNPRPLAWKANALPTELLPQKSSVGGDGFEPPKSKTADLQSAPFGHSGIRPDN